MRSQVAKRTPPAAAVDHDSADLPLKIKVGPIAYTIVLDAAQSGTDYGRTNPEWSQIIMSPNQSSGQMRDTLLHEIFHLVCDHTAVNRGGDNAILPDKEDLEERLVAPFATCVLDILRSNPDLVSFLLAEDD